MAKGIDVGTWTIVQSTRGENNEVKSKREINAFLEVPLDNRFTFNMMKKAKVPLIERENVAYVVGEAAVNLAYTLQLNLKRPMKDGCLNPQEKDAFRILSIMIHSLIGEAAHDKEILYYSVPANAVNQETDADYHQRVLEDIFKKYKVNGKTVQAYPMNEALALIFAELGHKNYTGIGISCLVPGTKIYTSRGLTNIENVQVGDMVITHKGRWRPVTKVIRKPFCGMQTQLTLQGYSEPYRFVDNHELYVRRNNDWKWVGCEEITEGDVVGEPIVYKNNTRPTMILSEPSMLGYQKQQYEVTENLHRLFGYFMGCGSTDKDFVYFRLESEENKQDVETIVQNVFGKNCERTATGLRMQSKGLVSFIGNHCFNIYGEKIYPWSLERLSKSDCINVLAGLVRSSGWMTPEFIFFCNTNTKLILLAKQCFARAGVAACVKYNSQEGQWQVSGETKTIFCLKGLIEKANTNYTEDMFIEGFACSKVMKVQNNDYSGAVYDLQVEEDHSFSGPYLTIHNCGGGMVNLCYSIFSQPVFSISSVNSGDWIDKMAAKATGETTTVINREKNNVDLLKNPSNLVERAIQSQYRIFIEKTIQTIKKAIVDAGTKVRTQEPLDIVLAGGTSSLNGFVEIFKEVLKQSGFPLPIGEVIKPKDHHFAVSRGLLVAAENA